MRIEDQIAHPLLVFLIRLHVKLGAHERVTAPAALVCEFDLGLKGELPQLFLLLHSQDLDVVRERRRARHDRIRDAARGAVASLGLDGHLGVLARAHGEQRLLETGHQDAATDEQHVGHAALARVLENGVVLEACLKRSLAHKRLIELGAAGQVEADEGARVALRSRALGAHALRPRCLQLTLARLPLLALHPLRLLQLALVLRSLLGLDARLLLLIGWLVVWTRPVRVRAPFFNLFLCPFRRHVASSVKGAVLGSAHSPRTLASVCSEVSELTKPRPKKAAHPGICLVKISTADRTHAY